MACIYRISNEVNDKVYIGFTSQSAHKRWGEHKLYVTHSHLPLYRSMRKHGLDRFSLDVIYECPFTSFTRKCMEPFYIELYDSFKNGYNNSLGGEGSPGRALSEETKRKISEAHKGKVLTEEHIRNISLAHMGLKFSKERDVKRIATSVLKRGFRWKIISRDGEEFITDTLTEWVVGKDLKSNGLGLVANPNRLEKTYKGYTVTKLYI